METPTRMKFAMSFEEGEEQLACEQYEDAMRTLVHAHQLAVKLDDSTGAYISCDYLLASIRPCISLGKEEDERCFLTLVGFLRGTWQGNDNIEEEEERAWAAYFVGRSLLLHGEEMDDRAAYWLQICYGLASTDYLKYEVSMRLGEMFGQGYTRKAVDYFKAATLAALPSEERLVFTLYRLCPLLCKLSTNSEELCQLSDLKRLADLSDDPFIKGVSARVEGHLCYLLHQYHQSKKANLDAITILEHLPFDLDQHYRNYSLLDGDPTHSIQRIKITAESLTGAWYEIGEIELLGDIASAEDAFRKALQYGTIDDEVDALSGLARVYFWQGQLQEAEAYVDKMLELSEDSHQSAYALVLRARIIYRCHEGILSEEDFTKAHGYLDEAERKIARKWPGDLPKIQHWQGILYAKMLKKDQAIQKFEQSLEGFWDEEASLGPSNSEGRISHLEFQKFIFRYLQICLVSSEPEQVKRAIIWAEKERARDLIREMNDNSGDVGPISFDSIDEDMAWEEIESIVSLAGEDSVFLMFTQLQDNIALIYLLHAGDEPRYKLSVETMKEPNHFLMCPIFTRVKDVTRVILHPSPTTSSSSSSRAQEEWLGYFHLLLIEPWKDVLESIKPKKIILVPTEELSLLPFAALRDSSQKDDDEPYLIQQYALVYAPSLQVFKQCELQWEILKNRRPSHEQTALVVGNPTLQDEPELENLPSAQKEAVDVARMLQDDANFCDVKLLQENDATVTAVLDSLTSCNWVHMACHAIVNDEFPNGALLLGSHSSTSGAMQPGFTSVRDPRSGNSLDESRTLDSAKMAATESATLFRGMANKNLHRGNMVPAVVNLEQPQVERALLKFAQQTGRRAGRLTGEDISKKLQASAVVLSACSTGLGQVCGEGILGLSRSLHVAGVPATLVSLWKVMDKPTLDFIERLYSKLSEGLELALAVQSAMKSMIEEEDVFGNPEYAVENWAAFIMSGSPSVKLVY